MKEWYDTEKTAQHSVHPTGGSLRVFEPFAWLGVGSDKMVWSRPAHQRVTQAVGRLLESFSGGYMNISVVVFIVGAVFLALGLIGGGIKIGVKEGEASIPTMSPMTRISAFIIGVAFIVFGLWRETYSPAPISTNLPVSDLSPTEAKMEVDVGTIKISSSNSSGTQWCPQISATYAVEYESGVYSPWDTDSSCEDGCWTTSIYAYKNRKVEWTPQGGDFAPSNPDFKLGWENRQVKPEDAEKIARSENNRFETSLASEECLTFIALDGQPNYDGNRGEVVLRVKIIGQ